MNPQSGATKELNLQEMADKSRARAKELLVRLFKLSVSPSSRVEEIVDQAVDALITSTLLEIAQATKG